MLAARSSVGGVGGGHQPPHVHRRLSVASLSGTRAHRNSIQDAKRTSSSGKQGAQQRHKATLIRELETTWYLKMFGLGKEETVAHQTGMPYSAGLIRRIKIRVFALQVLWLPTQSKDMQVEVRLSEDTKLAIGVNVSIPTASP
ncbi:unnamed protein product [Pleuronectes platessa]|uniref:Uncharacterized protein n=1 Tax=Pleuronectes platessa TaxID=8262 RepID=A0A9N7U2I2_PLEPL|nr:unnamed protein product [Pleuronectes platessa]